MIPKSSTGMQVDYNGNEHRIQYVSAMLDKVQWKWATIEKDAYVVIYCLRKLRAYLLGSEFTDYMNIGL